MNVLLNFVIWINNVANYAGGILLAPVESLPGFISLCSISALLGIIIFVVFTLTANQRAFSKILNDITAHILAIFLFKDNIRMTMKSEIGLFACSVKLLWYSIVPMLVMSIPLSFVLAQMAMWYQNRPVTPAKETVVVSLKTRKTGQWMPKIILQENSCIDIIAGPVRLNDRGEIYWKIRPRTAGSCTLSFLTEEGACYDKHFIAGSGFMRLSPKRPGWNFFDILLYPFEQPIPANSSVDSIMIYYPERTSKIYGTNGWLLTFCLVSMVFAFASKQFIKIRT